MFSGFYARSIFNIHTSLCDMYELCELLITKSYCFEKISAPK